jgi:hypothetical protein
MLNITRFNPLEDTFDNLFRGLPVWVPNPERRGAQPAQFRMDVTENDRISGSERSSLLRPAKAVRLSGSQFLP